MTLYNGDHLPRGKLYIGSKPVGRLYRGDRLLWQSSGPVYQPKVGSFGDSTSAEYLGGAAVASLIAGVVPTVFAVPGHTIDQQLAVLNAQSDATMLAFDVLTFGGPGLNDVTGSGTAASTGAITRLQALISRARERVRPGCKIIHAQMTPAAQRAYDVFGLAGGAIGYQQEVDINAAIAGAGPTPITGVDARVTSHVAALQATLTLTYEGTTFSQPNCLNPIYDVGDHIHETTPARQIMANALRAAMVTLGVFA